MKLNRDRKLLIDLCKVFFVVAIEKLIFSAVHSIPLKGTIRYHISRWIVCSKSTPPCRIQRMCHRYCAARRNAYEVRDCSAQYYFE